MKLKTNEDQSVDTLPLLRIGNKTPMEGVTETKFRAETKDFWVRGQPGLQSEFQDSQGYTEKSCLKKKKNKKNKTKTKTKNKKKKNKKKKKKKNQ